MSKDTQHVYVQYCNAVAISFQKILPNKIKYAKLCTVRTASVPFKADGEVQQLYSHSKTQLSALHKQNSALYILSCNSAVYSSQSLCTLQLTQTKHNSAVYSSQSLCTLQLTQTKHNSAVYSSQSLCTLQLKHTKHNSAVYSSQSLSTLQLTHTKHNSAVYSSQSLSTLQLTHTKQITNTSSIPINEFIRVFYSVQ